jgi:hypothetical protein
MWEPWTYCYSKELGDANAQRAKDNVKYIIVNPKSGQSVAFDPDGRLVLNVVRKLREG